MSKLFVLVVTLTIMLFVSGCGYKAPPYYEKPKDSSVAL